MNVAMSSMEERSPNSTDVAMPLSTPAKPMNAMARMPATISVMPGPASGLGTSHSPVPRGCRP